MERKAKDVFLLMLYVIDIGLGVLFGTQVGIIHSSSPIGIAFSVFLCGLAAFNFLIDFDTIEKGIRQGSPKELEAYMAFGVLLTLVWLYLEVLRLLIKLKSKNDD
jgi:uncharacterized YccA/Bax inhibitor family protein